MPALYNLVSAKRLPDAFGLVGVSRPAQSGEDWRDTTLTEAMKHSIKQKGEAALDSIYEPAWRWLCEHMDYRQADLNVPADFQRLGQYLEGLDK